MTAARTPFVNSRFINIALWIAQILVAVSFCWAAYLKLAVPVLQLARVWPWAGELPVAAVRLLGLIDLAGGIGVLLPALTRIKPRLVVLAALGCVALQICAMVFHAARGETSVLPVNVVFVVLCGFIAWGRNRMEY